MEVISKEQTIDEYKEVIYNMVLKYIENTDDRIINSGYLKFFKKLFIRCIAGSMNTKIYQHENTIRQYLDKTILQDEEEIKEFFDVRSNIDFFTESFVFNQYVSKIHIKVHDVFPPYLLMQKAQSEMERAFIAYMNVNPDTGEYQTEEEQKEKEQEKMQKYGELLFSIAFYEIFLREFYGELLRSAQKNKETEIYYDGKSWKEFLEDVKNYESEELKEHIQEIMECIQDSYDKACEGQLLVLCSLWGEYHLNNLYAILRIIYLIEFINFNSLNSAKKDKLAHMEAGFWERLFENEDEEVLSFMEWKITDLFGAIYTQRNLKTVRNEINRVYNENNMFPSCEQNDNLNTYIEKVNDVRMDLEEYIEIMRIHIAEERTEKEEIRMNELAESLSEPIRNAIEEILEIPDNVEKERQRKGNEQRKNANNENKKEKNTKK